MTPFLRFYICERNGKKSLDSCPSNQEALPEGFVRWWGEDGDEIVLDQGLVKDAFQKSENHWRKRYEEAGLPSPFPQE